MSKTPKVKAIAPVCRETLTKMQGLLLEALRHREQEIFRYLGILVPAITGFAWLVWAAVSYSSSDEGHAAATAVPAPFFAAGTVGVLLILFFGAIYSLALGYNYRYITLELAKLETILGIKDAVLVGWPRSREGFRDRYMLLGCIPWCTPPDMIRVFWWTFLIFIAAVTAAATLVLFGMGSPTCPFVFAFGKACFAVAFLAPIRFGQKLRKKYEEEKMEDWTALAIPEENG